MARPIEATPALKGKEAEEFIRKMALREKAGPTKRDMEIFHNIMFMKDRKTPRCHVCGRAMKNQKDSKTGKINKHLWRCECMPTNIIMSVG